MKRFYKWLLGYNFLSTDGIFFLWSEHYQEGNPREEPVVAPNQTKPSRHQTMQADILFVCSSDMHCIDRSTLHR